jgi:hypothetical protein
MPVYPDAQQLSVEEIPRGGENRFRKRTTTLEVRAGPVQVLDFYSDALLQAGWEYAGPPEDDNRFLVGVPEPDREHGPVYTVSINVLKENPTTIELFMVEHYP